MNDTSPIMTCSSFVGLTNSKYLISSFLIMFDECLYPKGQTDKIEASLNYLSFIRESYN